jgi:hypothetical protein
MIVEPELLEIVRWRKRHSLPTVYEVSDDFTAFSDNAPLSRFYRQSWVEPLITELCKTADAVQVSSPALQQKFGHLNAITTVLHNQIRQPLPMRAERPPGPLVVGWAGMSGHLDDCAGLIEALRPSFGKGEPRRFQAHQLKLSIMTTPAIASELSAAGLDFQLHQTGSMDQYLQFLESLDIGIAYLGDGAFAAARSDGRFIEYASRGVVPLCSNAGTYAVTVDSGSTGFLFATPGELSTLLRSLHHQRSLLQRVRQSAHLEVSTRRNHRAAAGERALFYRSVIDRCRAAQGGPGPSRSPLSPDRGFVHAVDPMEGAFLDALLRHNANPGPELLAQYFALAQQWPRSYRVWDALGALYRQLGLSDNLPLIEDQRQTRRAEAFAAAFGGWSGPPVAD